MARDSTYHQKSAPRRSKILHHSGIKSSELFSAEALQNVVLPMKKKKTQPQHKVNEQKDLIGDQMTTILNSHPDFSFDPARMSSERASRLDKEGLTISPLFCQNNCRILLRYYKRLRKSRPLAVLLSIIGFCLEHAPHRKKIFSSLSASMLLLFSVLTAGLSVVLVTSHIVLMWACREASLLLLQCLMFLVDWNDVQKHCPAFLKSLGNHMITVGRWLDRHCFLRKRFAGREWNQDDFEFIDTLTAQSRQTDLWNLPPPCIQEAGSQLCLDQRYMARDEWSQATSKHVVGINYCYLMMREEHSRKRARQSIMFQHHSPSLPTELKEGHENDIEGTTESSFEDIKLPHQHQVMSLSTKLGKHTEHVLGLTSTSPSGGIELVRENQDSEPELNPLTLATLASLADDSSGSSSMLDMNKIIDKSDEDSCMSSVGSCSSAVVADMNWVDLSAKIGMRVLNSTHLQRVVASQEAAERLKNITEQFVASPKENGKNTSLDFKSPGEMQLFRALTNMDKSSADRVPQSLTKSPCRPVHSMWTSAAAAGASSEDENSGTSPDFGWRGSMSFDTRDGPRAPPKIIRTCRYPSASPQQQTPTEISTLLMEVDDSGQLIQSQLSADQCVATRQPAHEEFGILQVMNDQSSGYKGNILQEAVDLDQFEISYSGDDIHTNKKTKSCSYSHGSSYTEKNRREVLAPGVKVATPILPLQPGTRKISHSNYQMATVVSSKRICVDDGTSLAFGASRTENCLSVTCKIDKSFLRNGEFSELTFRVMDQWSSRYMPKHSKVPIGSCVATSYGVGIVVGWRVEDDCHVIRSLWQRRGAGAAHAYLTRDAIHGVLEAAVGFDVSTKCGSGRVIGYVDAARDFLNGRYIVLLQDEGIYKDRVVGLHRKDVFSCYGAQFIPVIEHIKEACDYQIMLDNYKALIRQQRFSNEESKGAEDHIWKFWSENLDILWNSFLKAVDEDSEFDEGVSSILSSIIDFLERLDRPPAPKQTITADHVAVVNSTNGGLAGPRTDNDDAASASYSKIARTKSDAHTDQENESGFWLLNDIFGGIFQAGKKEVAGSSEVVSDKKTDEINRTESVSSMDSYKQAQSVIRTLMRTVSLARAASAGKPRFRLALTVCRELLLFARTLIKVQQKNVSEKSLIIWKNALQEIVSTFGPLKDRLEKIGRGIAMRMEQQGRQAKIKVLRFADSILADETFLSALCQGEWEQCLLRIEDSMVRAKIIEEASCGHYRKTARFIYEHLVLLSSKENGATARNNEKLQSALKLLQLLASPKRSLLKLLRGNEILEILERILVRVFYREEVASRMLTIHASNFKSLRHLRILKDMSVAGRLWIPLLDAADEEFSYVVSRMPENAKEFMCPLSSIFSLCVAQFHKINAGNSTKDWLDFLMEEDGVRIIHDIDMKLILALQSLSRDVRLMIEVLPYYPSIDDDILNLMDEVQLDLFLKEASEAIDDADRLAEFIREKASTAIERFLSYLPKLSVPVQQRDLGDGWVLTCYGQDGGDLMLRDVKVRRENLTCQVMGGDALFLPIFGEDDTDKSVAASAASLTSVSDVSDDMKTEESVLDHIRELILQAQRFGSWTVGIGGVGKPSTDQYVASVLHELPITSVLSCAIDLWRNLEIDDDELLEIAIRDVSYQIQLHKELEEKAQDSGDENESETLCRNKSTVAGMQSSMSGSASFEETRNRFNPLVDATVLFLEIKNLSLRLENFRYRIEKGDKKTIFDPVFEGCGTVSIQNISILIRIECARERIGNPRAAGAVAPVLLLKEFEVEIENVSLLVKDSGADWLVNQAVKGFSESITSIVESNLKEQIQNQISSALEQMNSYFLVHPDILLNILGITMDDLEEHIVWI